ncbi:MAG: Imm27 family immunity protein [Acidobacteriota bacterium]
MIRADESEIVGSWVAVDRHVVGDDLCKRIELLTKEFLEEIGISGEGGAWETLYRDPQDGRFWVRIYPQGDMHGGGPASLICLSEEEAKARFPHLFVKKLECDETITNGNI